MLLYIAPHRWWIWFKWFLRYTFSYIGTRCLEDETRDSRDVGDEFDSHGGMNFRLMSGKRRGGDDPFSFCFFLHFLNFLFVFFLFLIFLLFNEQSSFFFKFPFDFKFTINFYLTMSSSIPIGMIVYDVWSLLFAFDYNRFIIINH